MARIFRWDHALCGRTHEPITNGGNGDATPSRFYTVFNFQNIVGSGSVCSTTTTRQVKFVVESQQGRFVNSGHCPGGTGDVTWNHGNHHLLTLTYDDAKGIWYGESNIMPLEDDYANWLAVEMWPTGCGASPTGYKFAMYVIDVDGELLTPRFGLGAIPGITIGSGAGTSVLYLKHDDCILTGEYAAYEDVLPKFLFGLPMSYSYSWTGDFVTDFGTFGSDSHDTTPACFTTQTCAAGSDPDYTGGGTFACRQIQDPTCGRNWSASWAWQVAPCCFYNADGDLTFINLFGLESLITFGANSFVSFRNCRFRNSSLVGSPYWQTFTQSFDTINSNNIWIGQFQGFGTWAHPSSITVTPIPFD